MNANDNYFRINKAPWNDKVKHYAISDIYDLAAFIKGKSSLMPDELEALSNVNGKSLLHLQRHFDKTL